MLGFCPLISAFDRSGKFGRSRRKDLGPSLCKDVCPFSCLNRCLGNGRWAAWRSGYSLLSSGFRVKLSSEERSSAVSVFWGKKQRTITTERVCSPATVPVSSFLPMMAAERIQKSLQHADPRLVTETHGIYDWYFLGCSWAWHLTLTEIYLVTAVRIRNQLTQAKTGSDLGA